MYSVAFSNSFLRDLKRCKKRGYDQAILKAVITELVHTGKLDKKFRAHKLIGNYRGFWECHIKADWLLIWLQDDLERSITLERTGTHSDLFK